MRSTSLRACVLCGADTYTNRLFYISLMKKRVANAVHIKISERGIAKQAHTEEKNI